MSTNTIPDGLDLHGVSKRFGTLVAIQKTDLAITPGQTVVLIGPSGCGKSTLLRLMIGLIRPDEGTVLFGGIPFTPEHSAELRHRMGYVIQDGGLFPHLTARDNVSLLARHLGRPPGWIDARVSELAGLTRFPLDGLGRFPAQLSGGQRQRVGLMRALMLDPDVLLLDEPLGALDPLVRSELQADLKNIFRTLRKTVVMVTHDMAEAAFFGDEIILLKAGAIIQRGRLTDLVQRPADEFVVRFINAQRNAQLVPVGNPS
jgi:osmoprotectant transport system ATP-binding protein